MKERSLRSLLQEHNLHLRRELGQNFIVEQHLADRVAELAGVQATDCVVEVGTGLGMLTRALAKRAAFVATIEIDSGLVRTIQEEGLLPENTRLIHDDVKRQDVAALVRELKETHGGEVRFVANLPFSAATPLLRRLLDLRHEVVDWSVILQKEVADRMFAPIGSKDYGSLAVLHMLCTELAARSALGGGCFFPAPKVDSALVCIRNLPSCDITQDELRNVERVVRAAFGKRRKTLQNALRGGGLGFENDELLAALEQLGVDPRARAEALEPEVFLRLARALYPSADSDNDDG